MHLGNGLLFNAGNTSVGRASPAEAALGAALPDPICRQHVLLRQRGDSLSKGVSLRVSRRQWLSWAEMALAGTQAWALPMTSEKLLGVTGLTC